MPEPKNGLRISNGLKWVIGIVFILAIPSATYFFGRLDKVEEKQTVHAADDIHHDPAEQDRRIKEVMELKTKALQDGIDHQGALLEGHVENFKDFRTEQRYVNERVLDKLETIENGSN
jgi:hypothetical protein